MTSVSTWYDVLGALPDARPDDIRDAWQERKGMRSSRAGRRGPRRTCCRPGQGLADEQALEPYPSPASRAVAPDVVGGQHRTGFPWKNLFAGGAWRSDAGLG